MILQNVTHSYCYELREVFQVSIIILILISILIFNIPPILFPISIINSIFKFKLIFIKTLTLTSNFLFSKTVLSAIDRSNLDQKCSTLCHVREQLEPLERGSTRKSDMDSKSGVGPGSEGSTRFDICDTVRMSIVEAGGQLNCSQITR
jgi:hypothetical protein